VSGLYHYLKQGPLLVGEVRGFKAEVAKKFDKSDKNAPPITFGVFKVNLELLSDGTPVMLSIYPDPTIDLDKLGEKIGLKRGAIVAVSVGKMELKNGQRSAVCALDAIRVLDDAEAQKVLAA